MTEPSQSDEQAQMLADCVDLSAGDLILVSNGMLTRVHSSRMCSGQWWGCWIHEPRLHALSSAPVRWREDRGTVERVCDHGVGHPDPQDVAYWWSVHGQDVTMHGCDGCCGERPDWLLEPLRWGQGEK